MVAVSALAVFCEEPDIRSGAAIDSDLVGCGFGSKAEGRLIVA
jgi:hypothetical protein